MMIFSDSPKLLQPNLCEHIIYEYVKRTLENRPGFVLRRRAVIPGGNYTTWQLKLHSEPQGQITAERESSES